MVSRENTRLFMSAADAADTLTLLTGSDDDDGAEATGVPHSSTNQPTDNSGQETTIELTQRTKRVPVLDSLRSTEVTGAGIAEASSRVRSSDLSHSCFSVRLTAFTNYNTTS